VREIEKYRCREKSERKIFVYERENYRQERKDNGNEQANCAAMNLMRAHVNIFYMG
jgi:hypothetical protein